MAVRLPTALGKVEKVTVSAVAVAAVTLPAAPKVLKATVLLAGVTASKPVPLMVKVTVVGALSARLSVLLVTVGAATMLATCTAAPELPLPATVTMAVRLPRPVGTVVKVTVSCVAVAAVTLPTAPRVLKATVLLAGVVEKLVPLMVRVTAVGALTARPAVLAVTVGAAADALCDMPNRIPSASTKAKPLASVCVMVPIWRDEGSKKLNSRD